MEQSTAIKRHRSRTARSRPFVWLGGSALALLLLGGGVLVLGLLGAGSEPDANAAPGRGDVLEVSGSAYPLILSPETAFVRSQVAVLGTVVGSEPARWNTPDGKEPADLDPARIPGEYLIYHVFLVQVERQWSAKGVTAPDVVRIWRPGGVVDHVHMGFEDWGPPLEVGATFVLFLDPPGSDHLVKDDWTSIQDFRVAGSVAENPYQPSLPVDELLDRLDRAAPPPPPPGP